MRAELHKVAWPSRLQTRFNGLLVAAVVVAVAVILVTLDVMFGWSFSALYKP